MFPPPFQRLVDHHPLFVAEFTQLFLELGKRRRVHRLDVQVTDATARKLVGQRAAVL